MFIPEDKLVEVAKKLQNASILEERERISEDDLEIYYGYDLLRFEGNK